jgi:serine/threonine-protein kinase
VLNFADLGAPKDHEFFCDGIAEELIHVLGQIKGRHVVARTSAFAFKGTLLDVRDIGNGIMPPPINRECRR